MPFDITTYTKNLLSFYLREFPNEEKSLQLLKDQLASHEDI